MNSVTTGEASAIAVHDEPPNSRPGSLLSTIAELARDKTIDKELLAFLMDRQERAEEKQAERAFNVAMATAQGEIAPVARTVENTQTKSFYAKLEHVDVAIRPIYVRYGFALSFDEEPSDGNSMNIVCYVSHTEGHTKKYRLLAPPDTLGPKGTPTKTELHGRGSTITFLRRYLTCNVFNVVLINQDDDGVRGGQVFITTEKVDEILAEMKRRKIPESEFVLMMGVRSIEEIQEKDLPKARNAMRAYQPRPPAEQGP